MTCARGTSLPFLRRFSRLVLLLALGFAFNPSAQAQPWSPARVLSAPPAPAESGCLQELPSGRLLSLWTAFEAGRVRLVSRLSADSGANWFPQRTLALSQDDAHEPQLAYAAGVLHLAWIERRADRFARVVYARSLDHGDSWSVPLALSPRELGAAQLALAAADSAVYLAWAGAGSVGSRIRFLESSDDGQSWHSAQELETPSVAEIARVNAFAGSGWIVLVLESWGRRIPELFMLARAVAATSWSDPIPLSNPDFVGSLGAAGLLSGSVLHAVWRDQTPSGNLIYASHNLAQQTSQRRSIYAGPPPDSLCLAGLGDALWIVGSRPLGPQSCALVEMTSANRGVAWSAAPAQFAAAQPFALLGAPHPLIAAGKRSVLFGAYSGSQADAIRLVQSPPPLNSARGWINYP